MEYDALPGVRLDDERFAGAEGLPRFLNALRSIDVSDFMWGSNPQRLVFWRRGRLGILDPSSARFLAEWEKVFDQKIEASAHLTKRWRKRQSADYSIDVEDGGVARVHAWIQNGFNVSMRIHPKVPKRLMELIPGDEERDHVVREFLLSLYVRRQGLIVLGGEVRSGKTSLENALYHEVNLNAPLLNIDGIRYDRRHFWIIGDPVEFYHENNRCVFTHVDLAERGTTQAAEIRESLRVPRNLVAVGEMRGDPASTEAAITASLAGTIANSTGHFTSIADIVSRFSIGTKAMSEESKRTQLASALQAIVTLKLLPGIDGSEHLVVSYVDFERHENLKGDLGKGMLNLNTQCDSGLRPMLEDLKELVRMGRIDERIAFPERQYALV